MRGFSMLEMLIAAGIALILGSFLLSIMVNNNTLFYKQNSVVSEGLDLNDAIHQIDSYIREAAQVADAYTYGSDTYTTGSETLILKIPALSASGPMTNVFDFAVITKDPANPKYLRLKLFPSSQSTRLSVDKILTLILDSVSFEYLDNNNSTVSPDMAAKVKVSIQVLAKTGTVGSPRSSTSVTGLRNF